MNVMKLRKGVKRTRENEVVCGGPVLYSKQLTGWCEGGDIYTADRKQSAAPKFKRRFSKTWMSFGKPHSLSKQRQTGRNENKI
jgi:hypothetical protein